MFGDGGERLLAAMQEYEKKAGGTAKRTLVATSDIPRHTYRSIASRGIIYERPTTLSTNPESPK